MKRLIFPLLAIAIAMTGCAQQAPPKEAANLSQAEQSNGEQSNAQTYNWLDPYSESVTVNIGRTGSDSDPKFPDGEALDNSSFTKWIKEQFNIAFKTAWLVPAEELDTKLSLDMAAGNLPDIYTVRNRAQLKQMIDGQMLADLTEPVENYSSDLMKDIYQSYGGTDVVFPQNLRDANGKIRAFSNTPPGYEFPLTWIRKDWLDTLKLPVPTNFAELKETAKAFIDSKMGGEKTTGIEINGNLEDEYCFVGSAGPWYHNFGAFPGNWYENAAGEYVYGSIQPEMKNALTYMAQMYTDGLIDYEFATKDWSASIANGESGIVFGAWWIGAYPLNNTKANNPAAEWVPIWIPSDNGEYNTFRPHIETESTYWVVNKNFANPDALIRMINIAAEQQNLTGIEQYDPFGKNIPKDVDTHYGDIGYKFDYHAWPVDAKVRYYDQLLRLEPTWMDLVSQVQEGKEIPAFSTESFNGQKIVDYMDGKDQSAEGLHVYTKTLALQLIAKNKESVVEKEIIIPTITPTMEMALSSLQDLEKIAFTKIIMGEAPIDSFETFVQDWNSQGGAQITKEVNEITNK